MIGRFASLAVSNTVTIKSYYQGKCYSYLMYKDGETLNIDLLSTTDTTYENGVEVSVFIKNAYYKRLHIKDGLAALAYFEQLYIDNNTDFLKYFVEEFNERTIHEFNNFKVCSVDNLEGVKFLMGNVLYNCPTGVKLDFFNNPDVAIICNIGDIDVTPNRESIRLSEKTKLFLDSKVRIAKEEIYDLYRNISVKDFKSIYEWYVLWNRKNIDLTLWEFPKHRISVTLDKEVLRNKGIEDKSTIRGHKIPKDLLLYYNQICYIKLPITFLTYKYTNKQFCRPTGIILRDFIEMHSTESYYLNEPYKPLTKKYFREVINPVSSNCYFINKNQIKPIFYKCTTDFRKWCLSRANKTFPKEIMRLIWEDIVQYFSKISTFDNTDVPKQWLTEQKEIKAKTRADKRDCIIYQLTTGKGDLTPYEARISTDSEQELDWYITKFKGTVVYAEKGSALLRFMFRIFRFSKNLKHIKFVETAKCNLDVLQHLKKFVHINVFVQDNPILKRIFTGRYLNEHVEIDTDFLSKDLCKHYKYLWHNYNQYTNEIEFTYNDECRNWYNRFYNLYLFKGWIDWSFIEEVRNPDILLLFKFMKKVNIDGWYDTTDIISIMYFVYKHRIHIGDLNPINAYKYLKETA